MTAADVAAVVALQEPASVRALATVFPQETHPFPRDSVTQRWLDEVADPSIECTVVLLDGVVAGFAATRGTELLHFGVALEHWGTGLAVSAHDAVLEGFAERGVAEAWLRVFTGNGRARRFYERLGWRSTGERSRSSFPPEPELLHYVRSIAPRGG